MKEIGILRKAAIIALIGFLFSKLVGYAYRYILTKIGPEMYGSFTLALSVVSFALIFAKLGIDEGILRFLSLYSEEKNKKKSKEVFTTSIYIVFLSSVIFAIGIYISSDFFANIFHSNHIGYMLRILSISLPFGAFGLVFIEGLKALKKSTLSIIIQQLTERSFLIIFTLLFFLLGSGIYGILWVYVFATFITPILSGFILFKTIGFYRLTKKEFIKTSKKILIYSLPLVFSASIYMLIRWADIMIIGYFYGPVLVGVYDVATLGSLFLFILPEAVLYMFIPIMTRFYKKKRKKDFKGLINRSVFYIFIITIIPALIMILFPERIIRILLDERYIDASLPLAILTAGVFFRILFMPHSKAILVYGKSVYTFYINLIATIFNIIFNIIFIPVYGIIGAAVVTSLSYVLIGILSYVFYKRISS